jgi:formylmethanofuran dehydrogenase subunit E
MIPDNYTLFEQHEEKMQRELEKLPRCSDCDEVIQEDFCYEINDELICSDCMESNYRKDISNYV